MFGFSNIFVGGCPFDESSRDGLMFDPFPCSLILKNKKFESKAKHLTQVAVWPVRKQLLLYFAQPQWANINWDCFDWENGKGKGLTTPMSFLIKCLDFRGYIYLKNKTLGNPIIDLTHNM